MKSKSVWKKASILSGLAACLAGLLALRSDSIVNWLMERQLKAEDDPKKRIVLINTTLTYDPEYWNPRYLRYALQASSDLERTFVADLIHERFGTKGILELKVILQEETSQSAKNNGSAVLSLLERPLQ